MRTLDDSYGTHPAACSPLDVLITHFIIAVCMEAANSLPNKHKMHDDIRYNSSGVNLMIRSRLSVLFQQTDIFLI